MNLLHFIKRIENAISRSVIATLVFSALFILPIIMAVVGGRFLYECPLDKTIPEWIIIGAIVIFTKVFINVLLNVIAIYKSRKAPVDTEHINQQETQTCTPVLIIRLIPYIVLLAWTIGGSILAFPRFNTVNFKDPGNRDFCYQTCFEMLYYVTLIMWCFLIIMTVIILILMLIACLCIRRK